MTEGNVGLDSKNIVKSMKDLLSMAPKKEENKVNPLGPVPQQGQIAKTDGLGIPNTLDGAEVTTPINPNGEHSFWA